ncbi:MAG: phage tail tape measure protein [Firmicutes bacterium]|nr:phage tail tape measure protein [Candidatus Colivicinus equi]
MAKHESKELMNEFFKDFNKHFDEEMNKAEERMSKKTKKAVEDGVSDGIKQAVSNLDIGTLNIGINDVNVSEKELKQALQKGLLEASKKASSSLKTEIDLTDTVVVNDDIIKKRINKLTETLEINYNKVFEKGQKLTRKQAESYGESFLELERYLKTSGSNIPEKYQQLMTNLQKNVNSNAGTIKLDSMVSTANGNFDYFFERAKSSIVKQQKQLINEVSQAQKALLDVVNNSNVGNDTPPTAITKIGEEAEKSAEKVRELNNEIEKQVKSDILSGSNRNQIPVLSGETTTLPSYEELYELLNKIAIAYDGVIHNANEAQAVINMLGDNNSPETFLKQLYDLGVGINKETVSVPKLSLNPNAPKEYIDKELDASDRLKQSLQNTAITYDNFESVLTSVCNILGVEIPENSDKAAKTIQELGRAIGANTDLTNGLNEQELNAVNKSLDEMKNKLSTNYSRDNLLSDMVEAINYMKTLSPDAFVGWIDTLDVGLQNLIDKITHFRESNQQTLNGEHIEDNWKFNFGEYLKRNGLANQIPLLTDEQSSTSTENHIEELAREEQQALETAQAEEKLAEARNESSSSVSQSPIEQRLQAEKETVDEVVNAEKTSFDELITYLDTNVVEAIETKTLKFEDERDRVHNVVEDEIGEIDRLVKHINEVAPEGNININVNSTLSSIGEKSIVDGEQRDDVADRVNRSKVKTTSIKNAELLSIESKEELAEAIEKEQSSIMNALEKEGEFIKEVTAFYDSADNLVKQQFKSIDKDGNIKTYTTRYSVNKDGEAQVWSSHIDNEKYVDEANKATESIKNAFVELRREAYQSIGQKSEELSKMAEYYEQQQKEYSKKEKQIQDLYKSLDSDYIKAFNKEDKYPEEYSHKLKDIKFKLEELKKYKNLDIFDEKEIDDAKKLGSVIEELFTDLGNIEKKANTAKANSVAAQISQYSSALTKNTRLVKDSKIQMQGWIKELQNPDINPSRVQEIITAFGKLKVEINDAGNAGRGFVDIFKNKLKYGIAQQLAMYFSFNDFLRYGREIFNTIRELDTALVDLQKTTKMSSSEMNRFYFESNNVAKELGVTTKEVIEQASAWSRLGYSSSEAATEMAKLSSQFASISPGMNTDSAQEGLVSIMKAWDIGTDQVEREVMDNINVLGNKFAETNQDIVEGMKRSASTFAALGQSWTDSFAIFTGAQEVVQNAETVGKSISAYLYSNIMKIKVAISVKIQRWTRPRKDYNICLNF